MANSRTQQELPFAEAEAACAERWNDVRMALRSLSKRDCDLGVATFVRWVFNVTAASHGPLVKTYEDLGEHPDGLCCSARTARRIVTAAERLRLVCVAGRRNRNGSQDHNAYTIDWDGVRLRNRGLLRTPSPRAAGGGAGGQFGQTSGQLDQTSGQIGQLYKEQPLCSSLYSGTGPGAGPKPNPTVKDSDEPQHSAPRTACDGSLTGKLLGQSPLLAEARERRIAPLPPGGLLHGVYAPITVGHLKAPERLIRWHRMQLSTVAPVMGDTEADLLLTIATALYATSLPDSRVQQNRVAVFVGTICRHRFMRSLGFVPKAREVLDEAIASHGAAWVGIAAEVLGAASCKDPGSNRE